MLPPVDRIADRFASGLCQQRGCGWDGKRPKVPASGPGTELSAGLQPDLMDPAPQPDEEQCLFLAA